MNAPNVAIPSPKYDSTLKRKWVIMDTTLDRTYLVDGQPASVLDVHDVLRWVSVLGLATFQGSSLRRIPHINAFLPSFRHIYALQTNDKFDGYGVDLLKENVCHSCI